MHDGEAERDRLIDDAARLLSGKGAGERPATLAADLFARASLEDLANYSAEEIAACVRSAGSILAMRKTGRHEIRIEDLAVGTRGTTLLQILNDNMPFLVDSVLGELQDFGADIRLVAHPILSVERDKRGRLVRYLGTEPAPPPAIRESLIQVHVGPIPLASERRALVERLDELLTQVRRAVADWRAMVARVGDAIAAYKSRPPAIGGDEVSEAVAFL